MTEFESTGHLVIEEIEAAQNVNADLRGITVQMDSDGRARTGRPHSSGGGGGDDNTISNTAMLEVQRRTLAAQRDSADFDEQRNKILEDILITLQDGDVGGGGGGGGGTLSTAVTGGLLARGLGGLAGAGPGIAGMGTLGTAGAVGAGAGLGLLGVRGMQEAGITDAVRGAGQAVGDMPGGDIAAGAAPFLTAGVSDLGAASLDIAQGDFSFSNLRELQLQRVNAVEGLDDAIDNALPTPDDEDVDRGSEDSQLPEYGEDGTITVGGRDIEPPSGLMSPPGTDGNADNNQSDPETPQDPPFFTPGGNGGEDPPFFRPPGPGAAQSGGNQEIITPVSQQEGLLGATARAQSRGADLYGAGADPSTPGGMATAGRTRPPGSVGGGGGGGATDDGGVDVNSTISVTVEKSRNLDSELDRRLQQLKSEILREVQQSDTTSGISARQQQSFQRNL